MPLFRGTRLPLILGGRRYIDKVLSHGPIAYWPMNEPSGSVSHCLVDPAQDGAYTGVTLGQPGIGDGNTCPLFDGSNDVNNIYSTTLRDAFNGAEGTLACWGMAYEAATWEDDVLRYIMRFRSGGNNYLQAFKDDDDNKLRFIYKAGGTEKPHTISGLTTVEWFHTAMTWSKNADKVRVFLHGEQDGSTMTGLGTWSGTLASNRVAIGAGNPTPTGVWHGWLAHGVVWTRALAPAAILDIATL